LSGLSLFFDLIKDNLWHSVSELSKALGVPPDRLSEASKLLSEHNVIEYRQDKGEVKMNPKWKFIFEEYTESEEEKQRSVKHGSSRKKRKTARHNSYKPSRYNARIERANI
jgi:DNA-binding transcriptional regulator YhcF (GntR family)